MKKAKFVRQNVAEGTFFSFASSLDKIGVQNDLCLRTGSYVTITSEPIEFEHPKYGLMILVRVLADVSLDYHTFHEEFWMPVNDLMEVADVIYASELKWFNESF
jgi:hypothetical protein